MHHRYWPASQSDHRQGLLKAYSLAVGRLDHQAAFRPLGSFLPRLLLLPFLHPRFSRATPPVLRPPSTVYIVSQLHQVLTLIAYPST